MMPSEGEQIITNEEKWPPQEAVDRFSKRLDGITKSVEDTIRDLQSQLAAETMRAGEYQQERDRLRDAISRVEDWMHDDRAGMSALAAIIQDATGEAAIAPPQQRYMLAAEKVIDAINDELADAPHPPTSKSPMGVGLLPEQVAKIIEDCLTAGKAE